jgi:hypothetical protein
MRKPVAIKSTARKASVERSKATLRAAGVIGVSEIPGALLAEGRREGQDGACGCVQGKSAYLASSTCAKGFADDDSCRQNPA